MSRFFALFCQILCKGGYGMWIILATYRNQAGQSIIARATTSRATAGPVFPPQTRSKLSSGGHRNIIHSIECWLLGGFLLCFFRPFVISYGGSGLVVPPAFNLQTISPFSFHFNYFRVLANTKNHLMSGWSLPNIPSSKATTQLETLNPTK